MAKQVYDDEKIKAIADKIRKLVPTLNRSTFTTGDIPYGIQQVFAEGKAQGYDKGKQEGYNSGYSAGQVKGKNEGYAEGYNEGYSVGSYVGGVKLPTLTTPGTANDLIEGKQLIDGKGNIVEGAVPVRTTTDLELEMLGQFDLGLTVTSGYYKDGTTKIIDVEPYYNDGQVKGYANGYNVGLADGVDKVKTEEARNESDVTIEGSLVTVPSGYYTQTTEKEINTDPFYDAGFEDGYEKGKSEQTTYENGNEVRY